MLMLEHLAAPVGHESVNTTMICAHVLQAMRRYLRMPHGDSRRRVRIRKTRFGEIAAGLQLGGVYALDEAAYNRFRPLADGVGVDLAPQDFTDPDPSSTGVRLVHIRTVTSAPCEPAGQTPGSRWGLTRALRALFY